ncbi:hypothetical protein Ahos_1850 [Acidianus hospitalis W1]|uniref:Uncharacterized protein n=1 Tax=Acidianus hospitalis (strain W1) TaxID=933801 RepID=F4B7A3_ACIHW|nr:hypothetical protein Ahos_1850 [Acidianus hospitalis W1]
MPSSLLIHKDMPMAKALKNIIEDAKPIARGLFASESDGFGDCPLKKKIANMTANITEVDFIIFKV